MEQDGNEREISSRWGSRRQFLAAVTGVTTGVLAGCSSVTGQEFEATPVVLPEEARGELMVTETLRDSYTLSREVEGVDGEVTITNRIAVYDRGPDRGSFEPTLIERYLGRVNSTHDGGVVVAGSDLDPNGGLMDFIGQDYLESVPTDRTSLVVPAGLRGDSEGQTFLLWSTPDGSTFNPPRGHPMYVVDAAEFLPTKYWFDQGRQYEPSAAWFPAGRENLPGPDDEVLVMLGDDTPEEVFGVAAEEMPGERVEEGDSLQPFLVAAPDTVTSGSESPVAERYKNFFERYKNFFDAGVPAPTDTTYRVSALSTPTAEVAGESANPLAHLGFADILAGSEFMARPKETFLGDSVGEWLSGPDALSDIGGTGIVADSPDGTTIMGQDTDLKSFVGVVSSDHGPVGLGLHMARIENEDDVVIAAGTHSWPVGSAEYFDRGRSERFSGILGSILTEARVLTDAVGGRFERG